MAETLRINLDNVVLEVNDAGETVTLQLADERFTQRLFDYIEKMQSGAKELDAKSDSDDFVDIVTTDINYHQMLREEFNSVFGAGAYEKVYGNDIVVGVEYILQFIDQIMPYIEKHQTSRSARFSKYSANRVGSAN